MKTENIVLIVIVAMVAVFVIYNLVKKEEYQEYGHGPSRLIKELQESGEWEVFNFFNNGILRDKPASTGITFIQRCKK